MLETPLVRTVEPSVLQSIIPYSYNFWPSRGVGVTPLAVRLTDFCGSIQASAYRNKPPGNLKIQENSTPVGAPDPLGSLERSHRPPCWWRRASCPSPTTPQPLSALNLRASDSKTLLTLLLFLQLAYCSRKSVITVDDRSLIATRKALT